MRNLFRQVILVSPIAVWACSTPARRVEDSAAGAAAVAGDHAAHLATAPTAAVPEVKPAPPESVVVPAIGPVPSGGRQVAEAVCFTCHTETPPPKTAPPFRMIAMQYRAGVRDSAEGVARIVAWVRAPKAERSLLPAHVIQQFGLMPALALPDSQLRSVAAYVWSLGAHEGMQHGGRGRPPQ